MFEALFTFFFKYPVRVYEKGDFTLVPVLPPLVLLGAAFVVLGIIALVHSRLSTLTIRDRVILGSLRGLAVALLIFALFRPDSWFFQIIGEDSVH